MSPSTITPSTGPPASLFAHARAPAKPVVAPEVETSTSVLRSSRALSTRASSSSAAVPDRSARPGPSRWASRTMRRSDCPGRVAITVVRSPPRLGVTVRRTVNGARSPASSGALKACSTRSAMRSSSDDPAVRSGKAFARPLSDCGSGFSALPNARSLENASVGSVLRAGSGRSASANAATNSATSAGRKAVRYTRASSTSVEVIGRPPSILALHRSWQTEPQESCSSTTSSRSRHSSPSRCSATATRSCRRQTAPRRWRASTSRSSTSSCST